MGYSSLLIHRCASNNQQPSPQIPWVAVLSQCVHTGAVIWDALKAACDADLATAKVILESAGVVVASDNMTICYDERGTRSPLGLLSAWACWPVIAMRFPSHVAWLDRRRLAVSQGGSTSFPST